MDRRISVLAALLVLCFGLIFLQLNNFQVRQQSSLVENKYNTMLEQPPQQLSLPRGEILSSDGAVLARSEPTKDQYGELRVYPEGPLFADVTGYLDSTAFSTTGLEAEYNNYLEQHTTPAKTLRQILDEQSGTDSITLTVSSKLQAQAQAALGGRFGAVVAIQPTTGAILAMYSNPTFDPNKLAVHDYKAATKYYNSLDPASSSSPLVNGATAQTYPPGSTFKVVTTSAMFDLEPALVTRPSPYLAYTALPQSNQLLHNFDNEVCGGNLATILAVSCDTAYGRIGMELGASKLGTEAAAFGFNKVPPLDLPPGEVAASAFPTGSALAAPPFQAYSAIGQYQVRESALQDAMVAAAIADGGRMMAPHLLNKVIGPQGQVVDTYRPHVWRKATTFTTAAQVRNLMLGVTSSAMNGTAAGVFPPGLAVAAKTGTAQTSFGGCDDDWLIAMAPAAPGQVPKVAVAAVVLGSQPTVVCAGTGAGVAGPVVSQVLTSALADGL